MNEYVNRKRTSFSSLCCLALQHSSLTGQQLTDTGSIKNSVDLGSPVSPLILLPNSEKTGDFGAIASKDSMTTDVKRKK